MDFSELITEQDGKPHVNDEFVAVLKEKGLRLMDDSTISKLRKAESEYERLSQETEQMRETLKRVDPDQYDKMKQEYDRLTALQEQQERAIQDKQREMAASYEKKVAQLNERAIAAERRLQEKQHNDAVMACLNKASLKSELAEDALVLLSSKFQFKEGTMELLDENGTPLYVEDKEKGGMRPKTGLDLAVELRDTERYGHYFQLPNKSIGSGFISASGQFVTRESLAEKSTGELWDMRRKAYEQRR